MTPVLTISEPTLEYMAKIIRRAISSSLDDHDLAEAALQAFIARASPNDWDALELCKP